MTLAELEQQERQLATARDRVFRQQQIRNAHTLTIAVKDNRLTRYLDPEIADVERWIAANEAVEAKQLARRAELEAAIGTPPPDFFATEKDPMVAYGMAGTRQRMTNLQREELSLIRERLDAIHRGGYGQTDVPALLAAEGIRPRDGYTAVYRGRVPLPRARKALEALREERARVVAELDAARAALAALDAEELD